MLKKDLARAGIEYVDAAGRYADFHSLRHATGSLLAASGVQPKVAQSIMRHSDINLTMSRYTHTLTGQESEAVSKLSDFSLPSKEKQKVVATGTVNRPVGVVQDSSEQLTLKSTPKLTPTAYPECNESAPVDNQDKKPAEMRANHKPSPGVELDTKKAVVSPSDINGAGGIRTPVTFR
jgi:hypothetical protein